MSPYGFGIMAALVYLKNREDKSYVNNSSVLKEWLAFFGCLVVTTFGSFPFPFSTPSWLCLIYWSFSRSIYGLCLSYLMLLMVSQNSEPLPWYRPVRYMKWILSANFWVPIATLSYSVYIWHIPFALIFENLFKHMMLTPE